MKKIRLQNLLVNLLLWVSIGSIGLFMLYCLIQVTTACSFHTPTGSMTPTLLPDESGLVNKWKMGARIFNIFDAAEGKSYEIKRLRGYGKLERGDVIVFNYPYLDSDRKRDSIAMNLSPYYCKRAVAVAGDTLEIRDCFYHVRGCNDTIGVASEQKILQSYVENFARSNPDPREWPAWMRCCPRDSIIGWTVRDMGPFIIPGKGLSVKLDYKNWLLYRRYIEWETKNKLKWQDSTVIMNDKPIKFYTFTEDYCFAAGDHAIDSKDSRYFGLVPEKFIVGTAGIRWKSPDRKRLFKAINQH
ncbi:S26 family signal peptidase [uncultured Duncaniella sp.]|uniref:S26 family signal peptidase n=1 Tax=uncultured Duncaniella sp. TaxID=2768039 RepID=UPI0025DFE409|nr:S26 family signal peptidase [uncultured Duncaniella sp.]